MDPFDDRPSADARDPGEKPDPAEVWGRRVGRGLAVAVGAALAAWLLIAYFGG